ncbi:MAG: Mannose-1-phosphate guanylyltransferase (GDP) [uncultured Rubellimicrobium sp.]|uniref:Mannose-1-phosphate guanylyltransferase (GDP) n=1 Tax=uncultured Rubellimicrobium sp. TaxID=543078 RepID=A0A6J4Q2E3_9RHOB|nr:MAG: Mannose-1-phosphate guanylyltransferase (GDP) [uncultured Rubellimicrobium sp.]
MQPIHPVILSGGMGSRLWPLSRVQQPKQFQPIDGADGLTFLQATALRHQGPMFHQPVVVANASQVEMIASQMWEIGCRPIILGEPVGRNTGPAVLAAALRLLKDDPDAVMLILPSDHVVNGDLNATVALAAPAAREDGRIVTIGVVPRYAETGFGYITDGGAIPGRPGLHAVKAFVEKPALEIAQQLVAAGDSYWAAGIAVVRADVIVEEFARLEPATLDAVRRAFAEGTTSGNTVILAAQPFSTALDEPTERAIFERSPRVALAPTDVAWSDVGAWPAMHGIATKNASGNALGPEVLAINTRNSLVRGCGKLIAVVGMEDVIVVDTPDALLVTNHANAQLVKEAVSQLKKMGRSEVDTHLRIEISEPPVPAVAAGITQVAVAVGEVGRVTGTGGAGSVVTIAAGLAVLKIAGELVRAKAGEIFFVRPGETATIANGGSDVLSLVSVDIQASSPATVLSPDGSVISDLVDPLTSSQRRFVA